MINTSLKTVASLTSFFQEMCLQTGAVGMVQARLHLPAFTKGKDQLSALEVEETLEIAKVRIHVERVIGAVKQKFSILQSTLPIGPAGGTLSILTSNSLIIHGLLTVEFDACSNKQ